MKFLFTYAYKGKRKGKTETGSGSVEFTLPGTDKITPKVIENAVDATKQDLNAQGVQIDALCPMGWFKYEEVYKAESEDMECY